MVERSVGMQQVSAYRPKSSLSITARNRATVIPVPGIEGDCQAVRACLSEVSRDYPALNALTNDTPATALLRENNLGNAYRLGPSRSPKPVYSGMGAQCTVGPK